MNKKLIMIFAATAVIAMMLTAGMPGSDADGTSPEPNILIDDGNGHTEWVASSGTTLKDALTVAFSSAGRTFTSSGSSITVDGKTSTTIGGTVSKWTYYTYNGGWQAQTYNGNQTYDPSAYIAIGFYPSGICPTVTPEYKTAWTAIHGDSLNSSTVNNYDATMVDGTLHFSYYDDTTLPSCYASPLYANGHMYLLSEEYNGTKCHMIAYDCDTGSVDWDITRKHVGYEMATGAIYGGNIYFVSVAGKVSCIPISGPEAGTETHSIVLTTKIDKEKVETGSVVMQGLSSIVYDSGHLFLGSSSGEIHCLNPDLTKVWSVQLRGSVYPSTSISVANGLVYVGGCDGNLYVIDEANGTVMDKFLLYYNKGGRVGTPAVIGDTIFVSYNDGQGMSSMYSGFAVLKYNSATKKISFVKNLPDLAIQSNCQTISPSKQYVFGMGDDTLYRIYSNGTYEAMFEVSEIHGALTLVNNTYFYGTDYDEKGTVNVWNQAGEKKATFAKDPKVKNYSMGSTVVVGNYVIAVTDSGAMVIEGVMVDGKDDPDPTPGPKPDPGPEPAPAKSSVRFLLMDEYGFYITIEGEGTTVLEALQNACDSHGYSKWFAYEENPFSMNIFGLGYESVSLSEYKNWFGYMWNGTSWVITESTVNELNAEDVPEFMLHYTVTDGSNVSAPLNVPESSELVPLKVSGDGTRFLLESSSGMFMTINGSGDSLQDAFENACEENSIPYTIENGVVTLFGITPVSDSAWHGFIGSSGGWDLSSSSLNVLSSDDVNLFALYYGTTFSLPSIDTKDIYSGWKEHDDYSDIITYALVIIIVVILAAILAYIIVNAKKKHMTVGAFIHEMLTSSNVKSRVKRNKIRLLIVCTIGFLVTFCVFLCCLAIGTTGSFSLPDTISALSSAIGKHGKNLDFMELAVYDSRLPCALAALAVGIGLSVAGCVYQAIIRNPLVDPYIMGVSSGAGALAVAAIAADFTFFGLLSTSVYSTPVLAIFGGLLAFTLTMIIAEKSGGSSTNYVLAGVIIGMVFSAIQTYIMVDSDSDRLSSTLSWLFGSFANIDWDTVWIIFFPAIFLSLIPLFWAKELNLVLLGEDQARQMGLDVRKFNRMMLILASILTAICVAFCGIIGFVGMVIPHLARMILGGDHRLVLPASIMMGGGLMLFAYLLSMTLADSLLPVGIITTMIGVPVFAYLLIKKGRMYNG